MSKLLKLKEWVTVPQAATYLSDKLGEEVSTHDLFQLAVEARLKLFFHFKNIKAEKGFLEFDAEKVYLTGKYKIHQDFIESFKLQTNHYESNDLYFIYDHGVLVKDKNDLDYTVYPNNICETGETYFSALFDGGSFGYLHMTNDCCVVVQVKDLQELENNFANPDNLKPDNLPKENQKEIDSLLKMVITMATTGYRYDPKEKKSGTTGEIVNDAESLGINIDADTVRKWLKKSAQLLPPQEE